MKLQKKKKEFNDLLIPMILVMAVLPFVVRLISFDGGLSDYSWYSDFDVVHDFFNYYKSCAFLMIALTSFIILIPYVLLKKGLLKDMRAFLFLGLFAVFAIISTLFSVNTKSSLVGGSFHFESIFVLLGYMIMLIYTYQLDKKEEDYKVILRAFLISLIVMGVIGILQMIGLDLLYNKWIQKLIIPHSDWMAYVGNLKSVVSNHAVSLTLFNPNYASVYLAMVIPFLVTLLLPAAGTSVGKSEGISKGERILIYVLIILCTVLLFKTYSRTGLVSLAAAFIVLAVLNIKLLLDWWKHCLIILLCIILLFVGIDSLNNYRYLKKISGTIHSFQDKQEEPALNRIITQKQGVTIDMEGEVITVSFLGDKENLLLFTNSDGNDITGSFHKELGKLAHHNFEKVTFQVQNTGDTNYILCRIHQFTWKFYQDKKEGYLYINDYGKSDRIADVEHVGSRGLEDIGSGRGYIWSRSIPLLKNTLLIGSGPDTFPYVFPQSDYVGKANNCKTPVTFIERPHNMYLMSGIQTGVISMLALIIFYLIYLIRSIRIYRKYPLSNLKERIGLGCFLATVSYMVSGCFNDSSLQTTPLFIILLGLGMDINYQMEARGKTGIKC